MGLCPSRNRSIATSKALKEPIVSTAPPGLDAPQTNFKLRADADSFVPQPKPPVVKEPWEKFLDQKQKEVPLNDLANVDAYFGQGGATTPAFVAEAVSAASAPKSWRPCPRLTARRCHARRAHTSTP